MWPGAAGVPENWVAIHACGTTNVFTILLLLFEPGSEYYWIIDAQTL